MWKIIILASCLLLATVFASCPPDYKINSVISNSLQFVVNQNSQTNSQNYNHVFDTQFNTIPSLALALQDFSINYLSPHFFSVYPLKITISGATFQFDYTSSVWSKVKINFWASANKQLQVGYFKVDSLQVTSSTASVYTSIAESFSQNDNPVMRSFINGYDVSTSLIQLAINATSLQANKLTIKIIIGPTTQIKKIWLSYVIFSPSTASFASYGGSFTQNNLCNQLTNDISGPLYQSSYIIFGITHISLNGTQPIDFSSSITNKFIFTLSVSRVIDSIGLVYVVIGTAPSKLCSKCGSNMVAYENDCLATCPVDTKQFLYKDGGVACKTNSIVNNQNKKLQTLKQPLILGLTSDNSIIDDLSSFPIIISSNTTSQVPAGSVTPYPGYGSIPVLVEALKKPSIIINCQSHSFFNGDECVCQVGYRMNSGICQTILLSQSIPMSINVLAFNSKINACSSSLSPSQPNTSSGVPVVANRCGNPFQIWNGSSCNCLQGYSRVNGICQLADSSNPVTPPIVIDQPSSNSSISNCPSGQVKVNGVCTIISTPTPQIFCPANAFDNGLGYCVCSQGYYMIGTTCEKGSPCPSNSARQGDGSCKCNNGFKDYNGTCSQCPSGALWSSSSKQCIYVCGQNSGYSKTSLACECNPGYGYMNSICQVCPSNYFIQNGYCVTCPINSNYNLNTKNCDCLPGYYTNQFGICTKKCGTNEVYNSFTQTCSCIQGLGKVNGVCIVCPAGSLPTADGSACSACKSNEVLSNGVCVCLPGFAYNSAKICTACAYLPNGFIINGICSICPNNLIFDGVSSCKCPPGKSIQGSQCVSQCQIDQILDSQGNCYTCGSNQIIFNGKCVCARGFYKNDCGMCILSCDSNQFIFQGNCAVCPLNTIYNLAINGCSCPTNYYMDSYGICQKLVLQQISCPDGQYFDSINGCLACNSPCKTCSKSATQCLSCSAMGYTPNYVGVCVSTCGDGLIIGTQTCDTGSSYSAGCQNCQIQANYTCIGQPSVCKSLISIQTGSSTVSTSTTTTSPIQNRISDSTSSSSSSTAATTSSSTSLYQFGNTNINSNNVFITLKTNPTFTFSNPTEMQNFIQSTFTVTPKPTVYCAQRASPSLDSFDCLMIFPSGVPNKKFTVNFSYNYQGRSGATTVNVDPLTASNSKTSTNQQLNQPDKSNKRAN